MAEGDWPGDLVALVLHGMEQCGACLADQCDPKESEHGLPEGTAVLCVCVCGVNYAVG